MLFELLLKFLLGCPRHLGERLPCKLGHLGGGVGVSPGQVEVRPRALYDIVQRGHRGMERDTVYKGDPL